MDLAHPLAVVVPTLDGEVLRVLAGAEADFTTAQVHRIVGRASVRGIANTLARLVDQGIVRRQPVGRTWLYTLNREHLAAPHVIGLAQQRHELVSRISADMAGWEILPVFGAVFGSAVRADHTTASDIDLFLIRPELVDESVWEGQTELLTRHIVAWTGNDARLLEMTYTQVVERGFREPVLLSILNEGIPVGGDHAWFTTTLRGARPR